MIYSETKVIMGGLAHVPILIFIVNLIKNKFEVKAEDIKVVEDIKAVEVKQEEIKAEEVKEKVVKEIEEEGEEVKKKLKLKKDKKKEKKKRKK